jgi:hypothetical protein
MGIILQIIQPGIKIFVKYTWYFGNFKLQILNIKFVNYLILTKLLSMA